MRNIIIYTTFVILFVGCKKEIGPQNVSDSEIGNGNLLILNEGNFGTGNASVSIYNPNTKEVFNNQFKAVNGFGIGDVLQSVNRNGDLYYFVVNNSGKVVVTDTNLVYQYEITGFNSPRYIEFYGNKAFVTDLKQNAIYVVDLISKQITNQIRTQGWTETIHIYKDKLLVLDRGNYLSNSDSNQIYFVDPISESIVDSIKTNINPNSMVVDNNELWVLCSGKSGINKASLTCYNLITNELVRNFKFTSFSDNPSRLVSNKSGKLYYINSSLYSFSIQDTTISLVPFFPKSTENFYGLFYSQNLNELFITDSKDYTFLGEVKRLDLFGNQTDVFEAGIIPQALN
ncbi:MAG: YncE family protein [Flavobacteriales bacterium]